MPLFHKSKKKTKWNRLTLRLCAAIVVPSLKVTMMPIERRGDGGGYVQRLQAEEQVGDVIQACRRADDAIVFSRKIGKGPENKIKKQIREEEKRKKKTTTTSDSTVEE
ncbi:hypothetical protein Tco_0163075 [Tanacetum coccineum]